MEKAAKNASRRQICHSGYLVCQVYQDRPLLAYSAKFLLLYLAESQPNQGSQDSDVFTYQNQNSSATPGYEAL